MTCIIVQKRLYLAANLFTNSQKISPAFLQPLHIQQLLDTSSFLRSQGHALLNKIAHLRRCWLHMFYFSHEAGHKFFDALFALERWPAGCKLIAKYA